MNKSAFMKRTQHHIFMSGGAAVSSTSIDKEVVHSKYVKLHSTKIVEYGVEAVMYRHKKSGANVLSLIAPQDENKVFGITFRTPPEDSTGIPHILEHSVLCGSRKYPVKEPFVDLMRGSLQTFLNAFTYPDRTCYPVASMNTKDFYNLINVYLDAVLYPKCVDDENVLHQEGWHYELENKEDPLTLKGVVYNEMKGVYSSPDSLMNTAAQMALFPDNTYGFDSGGNPNEIPNLKFEQFQDFHSSYYHPANSRIYFYGDDDPTKRLELLDEYLRDFDAVPVDSEIRYQKKVEDAKKLEVEFPVQAADVTSKNTLSITWVLNHHELSPKESLALTVLDHLLLGTPSSPLRKILTESQLGESITGGGLSDELIQATFGVGLKGVMADNCERVEGLIVETLDQLAAVGFNDMDIQASLNTIEFSLREFNTGSFPRGLSLMLGIMNQWIYDKDPFEGIRFEKALNDLKHELESGEPVFEELLKKYFVDNMHRVTVNMIPNNALEEEMIESEKKRLSNIKSSMSSSEIQAIVKNTKELQLLQSSEDSIDAKSTIPKLGMDDLDPSVKDIPVSVTTKVDEHGKQEGVILTHDLTTAGVVYIDIGFDLSDVESEDLCLLPLLGRLLKETGTESMNDLEVNRWIGTKTGGVAISFLADLKSSSGKISDPDDFIAYMMLRGKATEENVEDLLSIYSELLLRSKVTDDQKRAIELLKEFKARAESSLVTSGHSYAAARLSSSSSMVGYFNEVTGGLTYVRSLNNILQQAEQDWANFSSRLENLRTKIVRKNGYVVNLTSGSRLSERIMPKVDNFLKTLPPTEVFRSIREKWNRLDLHREKNEGFAIASQVNYVVRDASVLEPQENVDGSFSVVSSYLSKGLLWEKIRVVGGAYGGFARFGPASGKVVFLSYRDPNLSKTLDIYDSVALYLKTAKITDEDILQTIIGCIGDLDRPMTADQKGYASMVQFLREESLEDRQRYRQEVLNTSIKDFREFAEKLHVAQLEGSNVVFGSESALNEANNELPEEKRLVISKAI